MHVCCCYSVNCIVSHSNGAQTASEIIEFASARRTSCVHYVNGINKVMMMVIIEGRH